MIIMIILCFILVQTKQENFQEEITNPEIKEVNILFGGIGIGSPVHVVISRQDAPLSYSFQQPSGDGLQGCTQVPCPAGYPDKLTCWRCCNYD